MEHLIITGILYLAIIIGGLHSLSMDINGNSLIFPKKKRKKNKR